MSTLVYIRGFLEHVQVYTAEPGRVGHVKMVVKEADATMAQGGSPSV